VSVARDLLASYQHVIEELRLVTGDNGVFDVRVEGELVYSKPETGEMLELFTELMGSEVPRYGKE
jgi:predicted Rdx family selenoprotein